ncbi:hypothetical protein ACFCYI_18685 [Streptomyces sp. NPDC056257]|uniref:hypothetical protein n=1 Tax=Streptomyces sp. NPDC056257 TaxID=3345765 RepID=UPI0035D8DCB8
MNSCARRRGRPGRVAHGAVCLGLVLAVAGCASGGSGRGPDSRPARADAPATAPATRAPGPSARLPIARYSLTAEESALLSKAERRAMAECMSRYGLPYDTVAESPAGSSDRRYGLLDKTEAQNHGYHPPKASDLGLNRPSDEAWQVITGGVGTYNGREVPSGGCVAEAGRALRGDAEPPAAAQTAQEISAGAFDESRSVPEVRNVVADWSACMKAKGFTYASPLDAVDDFTGRPGATPQEVSTAVADVACKEETKLVDTWLSAEAGIQQTKLAAHGDALAVLEERHRQQVDAARTILARAGE